MQAVSVSNHQLKKTEIVCSHKCVLTAPSGGRLQYQMMVPFPQCSIKQYVLISNQSNKNYHKMKQPVF